MQGARSFPVCRADSRRDVRDLEIAFGGNMALLFAVSILTNQVLTIDARALLTGGINGSLEEPKRTIWARRGTKRLPRDSGLAFMLEPTKTEQAIGAKGPQGNAQVDTRIKWERDTMCAMDEATAGVWSVADLGLDSVTVYLHFALLHDSRQRVVRIRERESWGSFTFG